MFKILEFKEFKRNLQLIREDDAVPTPDAAGAPAAAPPPAAPAPAPTDMGAPATLPADQPAAPAAAGGELEFIFLDDAKSAEWYGNHDENGGTKKITKYSISETDLADWVDDHKTFSKDKDLIISAVKGTRQDSFPKEAYEDFKDEIKKQQRGKIVDQIEVKFDSDKKFNNPSTDSANMNVVFLSPANSSKDNDD